MFTARFPLSGLKVISLIGLIIDSTWRRFFPFFIFEISGKEEERRINPSSVMSTKTKRVIGLNDSISRYATARVARPVAS